METIVESGKPIELFPNTIEEEIIRNVQVIIGSTKYSVVLNRAFGTRHREIDSPVNTAESRMIMDVIDAIETYEPRAEVTTITMKADQAMAGQLVPVVGVRIKNG